MLKQTRTVWWRLVAVVAFALGIIGLVLPVVPTVPFLVLAAWAAGKGSPALEARLLAHPRFGKPIRRWRERGAVSRSSKTLASVTMLGSSTGLQLTQLPQWMKYAVPLVMIAVAIWLWRRPEA
jgi:uncharacterized membrane protein YbaN (DUF454 family)